MTSQIALPIRNIPLNATVYAADGEAGRSTCIIVNPVNRAVTDFVLQRKDNFGYEVLVPVRLIKESTSDMLLLTATLHDLVDLPPFTKSEYLEYDNGALDPLVYSLNGDILAWPYRSYTEAYPFSVSVEQIPHDELGIHRGAHVVATDGRVGRVHEFLVDPQSFAISHLVLAEGHFWGKTEVTIPVSAIQRIEKDTVWLTLSKAAIERLTKQTT